MPVTAIRPDWQQEVFDVLKAGDVRQIAYVPDAGHSYAIRSAQADPDIADVVLTPGQQQPMVEPSLRTAR
jgi:hypothetical protein